MALDEAIRHCESIAKKCTENCCVGTEVYECGKDYEQLAKWLTELQELKLQIAAPRLGSIEEYHYELAKCKAAFWSCNRSCMDAKEQYRRKADELRKAQEQIAEYKRLLKAAVEDMNSNNICFDINACNVCTEKNCISCDTFHWRYTDEALKLIKEEK